MLFIWRRQFPSAHKILLLLYLYILVTFSFSSLLYYFFFVFVCCFSFYFFYSFSSVPFIGDLVNVIGFRFGCSFFFLYFVTFLKYGLLHSDGYHNSRLWIKDKTNVFGTISWLLEFFFFHMLLFQYAIDFCMHIFSTIWPLF